ncbi:YsnF/AvaK domain-containing protein, partial [Kineococcus auxinigenes]
DDAMTRSKEELHVAKESREAGRARLRKYITSETVTRSVPVNREEVVVEREPITEANRGAAMSGGDLTEEEHEVTLHEERAVAAKETVPVERVRLGTQTVQEEQSVSAEVREEHIDLDAGQEATTKRDRS